ncbi:hypothetical protein F4820DRAFT_405219 [Hypoxylon rubiginosum]|uniref:Uncharacterized protein n=1 Tax=Hypoxylon rubiginosum TaxID=110542 RepID=A0ACB9ZE39_9PEZI|nr:hypothetical protein F4820DRAFT_405219 [Hypoxylon rubiginosum]
MSSEKQVSSATFSQHGSREILQNSDSLQEEATTKAILHGDKTRADQPASQGDTVGPVPPEFNIVKAYPPRGILQQCRLAAVKQFSCCRCRKSKTSKLVAIKEGRWDQLWCNGCYGLLLSDASPASG